MAQQRSKRKVAIKKGNPIFPILIIVILAAAVYFRSLGFGHVNCDDHEIIIKDFSRIENVSGMWDEIFTGYMDTDYYRPLINSTFVMNAQFSGRDLFGYHLFNVITHCLFCMTLYILFRRLKIPWKAAFFATLLFTVHPVLTNSVAWIVGRNDMLLGLFAVRAFIMLIDALEKNKNRYLNIFLHALFLFMAFGSKETALVFPLVMLAYFILIRRENPFNSQNIKFPLIWLALLLVWFLMRSVSDLGEDVNNWGLDVILMNLRSFPEYISKAFIPADLSVLATYNTYNTLAGLVIIALIGFYIFRNRKNDLHFQYFGLLWFIILIAPGIFITLKNSPDWNEYLETRVYLPLAGLLLFMLKALPPKWQEFSNIRSKLAALIILSVFIVLTQVELTNYSSPVNFYKSAVKDGPDRASFHLLLAQAYSLTNERSKAEQEFLEAEKLKPEYSHFKFWIGGYYYENKNYPRAEYYFRETLRLDSSKYEVYKYLGNTYLAMNRIDESLEIWKRALEIWPDTVKTYEEIIYLYLASSAIDSADKYSDLILSNKWDSRKSSDYYDKFGLTYYKNERPETAVRLWERSIKLNHTNHRPYERLILYYYQVKQDYKKTAYYIGLFRKAGGQPEEEIARFIDSLGD